MSLEIISFYSLGFIYPLYPRGVGSGLEIGLKCEATNNMWVTSKDTFEHFAFNLQYILLTATSHRVFSCICKVLTRCKAVLKALVHSFATINKG